MGVPLGSDWRTEAHGKDHLCLKHWLLLTWASWGEISDLEIGLAPTMQERRDVLEKARLCHRCRSSADLPGIGGEGRTRANGSALTAWAAMDVPPTHTRPESRKGWVIVGVAVFTAAAALTAKTVLHSHTASAAVRPGGQAQHTTWHTRDVDVLQVKEGDCLPRGLTRRIIVRNVTVGSCHQPHREEVYAVFDLEPGHYHGQQSVDRRSDADCKKRFKTYVGIAYGVSEMHYEAVTPWATTLSARNRQVECVLVDIHRDTATLRGARR